MTVLRHLQRSSKKENVLHHDLQQSTLPGSFGPVRKTLTVRHQSLLTPVQMISILKERANVRIWTHTKVFVSPTKETSLSQIS
jgi:hypothetical protein